MKKLNNNNNKYKSKYLISFLTILLFIISILNIGYSSWNLVKNEYKNKVGNSVNDYVCFNDKTNIKYYTIEDALNSAKSGETIYCYKNKFPTIYSNVTINSGVTLTLPICIKNEKDWDGRQKEAESSSTWRDGYYTSNQFADQTEESVKKYLVNRVIVASNVILTNLGTINIGGIVGGNNNTKLAGYTSGYYSELYLNKGSKIINKGIIDCLGYIKEDSNNKGAILENYGIVKLPMVFYDYKGGSFTASVYANGTYKEFPLSQYDFPNIKIEQNHYYGCKMIGYVGLYTGEVKKTISKKIIFTTLTVTVTIKARHNISDINFISTEENSLFRMTSSGFINIRYISNNNDLTTINMYNNNYAGPNANLILSINGNVDFNYFEISLNAANDVTFDPNGLKYIAEDIVKEKLNTTMETSKVDFPVPWNFTINVNPGYTLNFNQKVKLLGGSKLNIKDGASVNINNAFILYDSSNNDKKLYKDTANLNTIYPYDKGDARLINEGTLNINSGAKFGGKISAISEIGNIKVNSGATLNYETQEGSGSWAIDGININFSFTPYTNSPITKYACVDLYDSFNLTNIEVGTYKAINSNNNQYGFKKV